MNRNLGTVFAGLCGLATLTLAAFPAFAQMQDVKPKPPMYSYVADWQVPRANWPELDKAVGPLNAILQKALDDGTIIGYGRDTNLVHTRDGETHDNWWSSMSMAGLVKVLEQARAATDPNSAALNGAKHWDHIWVSRYYNWKSGAQKGVYTYEMSYKLKDSAPDDTLDNLSQHFIVPELEKLVADGTLVEYEIDTMAVHTGAPGLFAVVMITPKPEGLDTVRAAILAAGKDHPLAIQTFDSATDSSDHRDGLDKTDATYK